MSVDHFSPRSTAVSEKDPLFLHVKAGMTVVVSEGEDWWMGDVIWMEGGARDPRVPTLFQIACVDTGTVRWVECRPRFSHRPQDLNFWGFSLRVERREIANGLFR